MRARPGRETPALRVVGLGFSYGGSLVLEHVSFEVQAGQALAVLGTNGAGKSTVLRLVAGLERQQQGRVVLQGRDVSGWGAHRRAAAGVVLVRGGRGVFADLTVQANLDLFARLVPGRNARAQAQRRALEAFPVLAERLRQPARLLSGGERHQLALAKAVLMTPRVLCVDELSLGLSAGAREVALACLRGLSAQGTAVLVVEQDLVAAADLCPRAVFLDRGRVRLDGTTEEAQELARPLFFDAP